MQEKTRCTESESLQRMNDIYRLLIQGASYNDIRRYCREKLNLTSHTRADYYIKKVKEKIRKENQHELEQLRAEQNARLDDLYTRAYKIQQYGNCISILREKSRLNGLDINNVKVTVDNKNEELLMGLINGKDGEEITRDIET